jgi:hypothetical protein
MERAQIEAKIQTLERNDSDAFLALEIVLWEIALQLAIKNEVNPLPETYAHQVERYYQNIMENGL